MGRNYDYYIAEHKEYVVKAFDWMVRNLPRIIRR